MKAQIKKLKRKRMAFDPKKNNNKRNVDLKKNMAELEQYYGRKCIELIGILEDVHGKKLENSLVKA